MEIMSDVGEPLRIIEDEPISWPDDEPLAVPVPVTPEAEPADTPA